MKWNTLLLTAIAAFGVGALLNLYQGYAGGKATESKPEPGPAPGVVQPDQLIIPPDHEKPPEVGVVPEDQRAREYAAGNIDFNLLRTTEIHPQPPPVYTDAIQALDNETVRIRGFMAPYDDLDDMSTFMLFPFPVGCFFCAPPSIVEVLLVRQRNEGPNPFIESAIEVTATLKLWSAESEDEGHQQKFVYVLDEADVVEWTPEEEAP